MQKSSVFMVLCIGHIIGEYFLTNKYIVKKKDKKKDKKKIFCYCLAYIIPFIIIGMLFYIYGYNIGKICLECICIHFIIEVIKRWIENYDIRTNKLPINVTNVIYVCSLIFHILSFFLIIWKSSILVYYFPEYIIKPIPYLLYFLCIAKPANITFKILFSAYQVKPESEQEDDNSTKTKNGAGALVGILERFLCAVFIVLGQYSAVGLTMTAKSIARYDQITKNPAFAEYYLIGTLYSIYIQLFYMGLFSNIFYIRNFLKPWFTKNVNHGFSVLKFEKCIKTR